MPEPAQVTFMGVPEEIVIGDGVLVRRYREADLTQLVAVADGDREYLAAWLPWAREPITLERQRAWLAEADRSWEAGTDFAFGVFTADATLVGGVGYHARNGPGVLEIGYWLAAAWQGRGVMTQVVRRLTQVAADLPGVHRVEIHCDAGNLRSAAVARRAGYQLVSTEPRGDADFPTGLGQVWAVTLR